MPIRSVWLVAAFVASLPCRALADPLAYVRASSQRDRETDRAKYHPTNLLDDDPETLWCEGVDGLGEGEEIRFHFKNPQRIDRVVIRPTDKSGRSVIRVRVSDGTNNQQIDLSDVAAERSFKSPFSGTNYTLSIVHVGPAQEDSDLPDDVACLADVVLYYKNLPFGGRLPLNKLRYDKMKDRILGRWAGAPLGASEKFIVFALDGTWEWTFEPLLGGKPERLSGEYRFRGNRLLMRRGETGRWADMGFSYERIKIVPGDPNAPLGDYDTIRLNSALGEKTESEYNNAEF